MRDVARLGNDADDEAGVVEHDVRVGEVEVDRAARLAPSAQKRRHFAHETEVPEKRAVSVRVLGIRRRFEQPRDLGVRHPVRAADHAFREVAPDDAAFRVELQDRRENEPVDARIQRAEPVRQALRQHRQDAAREVDRGSPRARLVVERASLLDVVRNVGDVDADPIAVRRLLDLDRVVEVLRGLPVDRDDAPFAKVAPSQEILLADLLGELLGLRHDRLREARRQVVRAQDDFDVHARVAEKAEPLLDLAVGDAVRFRGNAVSRTSTISPSRALSVFPSATRMTASSFGS